jgi:hypothetical protein
MSPVLLVDEVDQRWVLATPRWRDRFHRNRLDDELAAGLSPEGSRARAVRATALVEPAYRGAIADRWVEILADKKRRRRKRLAVERDRVRAAAADIGSLVEALRAHAPVPARGVAIANRLLTDGAGPLYRTGRGDLGELVRAAVRNLDADWLHGV